jgi:hypothetical protein
VTEEERDFVVFEGNPLEYGASLVVGVDGKEQVVNACWPEVQ